MKADFEVLKNLKPAIIGINEINFDTTKYTAESKKRERDTHDYMPDKMLYKTTVNYLFTQIQKIHEEENVKAKLGNHRYVAMHQNLWSKSSGCDDERVQADE